MELSQTNYRSPEVHIIKAFTEGVLCQSSNLFNYEENNLFEESFTKLTE